MLPRIIKFDAAKEYFTPEHCYISEAVNHPDDPQFSIARARVLPGITTALHMLEGIDERYLIISGKGFARVGELSAKVGSGDLVLIPAGVPQSISNIGNDDLIFYCICTPGFRPECYRDLEKS